MTDEQGGRPPAVRTFHIPEFLAMRRLREMMGIRGDGTTPEDSARRALYLVLSDLLRLMGELKRAVESGRRCRVVDQPQPAEPGTLHIKLKIEVDRS
jgi:hypothetical protein